MKDASRGALLLCAVLALAAGGDSGDDSLADLIEAQAGQLTDVLAHMRTTCGAAQRTSHGTALAPAPVAACVQDAEGAMSLVELLRGTVASPAGQTMPGSVRARWQQTLADAAAAIRESLTPLWDATEKALASGQEPPDQARALGHLRDRIGGVLSQANALRLDPRH